MKNTMKKLLCMALAIMLLVSAVPVFAAADNVSVQLTVTIDGSTYYSGKVDPAVGMNVVEVARGHFPANYTDLYEIADCKVNDASVGQGGTIAADTNTLVISMVSRMKNITLTKGGTSYTLSKKRADSITIGTGLLSEVGTYIGDNEQVVMWKVNGSQVNAGAQFSVLNVDSIDCVTEPKTPAVGTITAIFSVDGGSSVEKKVSANSKTVAELIAMCGYSSYDLDKAGLGGSGAAKGLNDTITAGQKVYIKMKTRATTTTPNTPANPSTPATPSTSNYIKFAVKVDSSSNVVYDGGKTPANGSSAKIGDLIKNLYDSNWASKYTFDYAWSNKNQTKITDVNATVYVGDTVTVMLKSNNGGGSTTTTGILNLIVNVNDSLYKSYAIADFTQDTINNLLKSKLGSNWADSYSYNNTVVGGVTYNNADVIVKAGQTATVSLSRKYSKDNSNKVYLHVYLNGDASTIAMTKDITGTYLMDDWYTDTTEILNYLKNNYYSAKDTSNAVTIDGLYVNTGSDGTFPANYYADKTQSSVRDIKDKLESGYVHISVMLKNAKAKSSATADTSNPKTGDTIFVPVMVMSLTGSVLAAAYIFGKKRFAR